MNSVTQAASGGYTINHDADSRDQAEVHAAMVERARIQEIAERIKLAMLLLNVAGDLTATWPYVHVSTECADNPRVTVVKITRQQYPPGHPAADLEDREYLFKP